MADEDTIVSQLLRRVPLVDGHNDLPWQFLHRQLPLEAVDLRTETCRLDPPLLTDIPRLRAGGVGAQFWAIYVPPKPRGAEMVRTALEQLDLVHRMVSRYGEDFELALGPDDIEAAHRRGKIACLIGLEGGHLLDNSLPVLRMFYQLGARYLTLTHVRNTDWADAAGDVPRHHGLAPFGHEVVREMNRLGMLLDLSHVADETSRAVLQISQAPVIFSHSSARAVCNHPRNVPDDILKQLAHNGGIVMACFLPGYLTQPASTHMAAALAEKERLLQRYPDDAQKCEQELRAWHRAHRAPPVSLNDVADHIDHLRQVAGIDHVGIGSDFEGFFGEVKGLEDVSRFPALLLELLHRGYSEEDLAKIAGLNFLRVYREVLHLSKQIKAQTGNRTKQERS